MGFNSAFKGLSSVVGCFVKKNVVCFPVVSQERNAQVTNQ